jgi:hypothetical protein
VKSLSVWSKLHLAAHIKAKPYVALTQDGEFVISGGTSDKERAKIGSRLEKALKSLKIHEATEHPKIQESLGRVLDIWHIFFGFKADLLGLIKSKVQKDFIWIETKDLPTNSHGFGYVMTLKGDFILTNLHPSQFVVKCDKKYLPVFVSRCAASAVAQLAMNPASGLFKGLKAAKVKEYVVNLLTELLSGHATLLRTTSARLGLRDPLNRVAPMKALLDRVLNLTLEPVEAYDEFQEDPAFASIMARLLLPESVFSREVSYMALEMYRQTTKSKRSVFTQAFIHSFKEASGIHWGSGSNPYLPLCKVLDIRWGLELETGVAPRLTLQGIAENKPTPQDQLKAALLGQPEEDEAEEPEDPSSDAWIIWD